MYLFPKSHTLKHMFLSIGILLIVGPPAVLSFKNVEQKLFTSKPDSFLSVKNANSLTAKPENEQKESTRSSVEEITTREGSTLNAKHEDQNDKGSTTSKSTSPASNTSAETPAKNAGYSSSTQSFDMMNSTNISTATIVPAEPILPDKGSADDEHNSSMSIFFVLCVLALGILLIHLMLQTNFQYLPESVVIVFLGGIMAILFNGIVMSHYTHFNLSTVTQITMQQTMRTLAFIAETCVFAYLGLALFSFRHRAEPALVVWSLILCLIGRATNIFPLSLLVNKFREHKITKKMMFIMWFSGLRGAISYALSLHLNFSDETRHVIITTTLIIVLFTTLILGGSTMPLLKFLRAEKKQKSNRRKRRDKEISLSKTREWGQAIDSEHLSEFTEEEVEVSFTQSGMRGFASWDYKFFIPLFTRRFTQEELKDCKSQMTDLTNQWYQAIRISPVESDEETTASTAQLRSLSNNNASESSRGTNT